MATQRSDFETSLLNWPPSFSFSLWRYSSRGWDQKIAIDLARELVRRAGLRATAMDEKEDQDNSFETKTIELIGEYLKDKTKALEYRIKEVKVILNELKTVKGFNNIKEAAIIGADKKMSALKHDIDNQLVRATIAHDEYAINFNESFNSMNNEFKNILTINEYKALFGVTPDEAGRVELIQREYMLDSYEKIKNQLKL